MAKLAAGYIGILSVGGQQVRCTSFGVNSSQEVLFYNPVLGINDTLPSGDNTKGETPGTRQTGLRNLLRPSVIGVGGSIAFPATHLTMNTFFDNAKNGGYINEIDFQYYCEGVGGINGTKFSQCRINSFEINAQAEEVVGLSVDIGALGIASQNVSLSYKTPEKLVTWDKIHVTTSPSINHIRGVTFRINNNLNPIYTAGASGSTSLFPNDLRLGIQEVSGTVSFYLKQGQVFIPTRKGTADTIQITGPNGFSIYATILFQTTQAEGTTGPVVCELPFVGVGNIFV